MNEKLLNALNNFDEKLLDNFLNDEVKKTLIESHEGIYSNSARSGMSFDIYFFGNSKLSLEMLSQNSYLVNPYLGCVYLTSFEPMLEADSLFHDHAEVLENMCHEDIEKIRQYILKSTEEDFDEEEIEQIKSKSLCKIFDEFQEFNFEEIYSTVFEEDYKNERKDYIEELVSEELKNIKDRIITSVDEIINEY